MENWWGKSRRNVLSIFVLWWCFHHWWLRSCGVEQNHLGQAEITSFPGCDLSGSTKHDTFWEVISSGYFCILFLWAIGASYFHPLDIYKNLVPPLPSIIFTVNSHATALIFQIKNGLQKKHFIEKIVSFLYTVWKLLNYMLYIHDITCNLSWWNNGGNDL